MILIPIDLVALTAAESYEMKKSQFFLQEQSDIASPPAPLQRRGWLKLLLLYRKTAF